MSKVKKTVADVAEEVISLDTKIQTMERVLTELVSKHEENQTDMVSRIEEVMSLLSKLPQPIGTEAKTSRRGSKGSSDSDSEHGSTVKRRPNPRKPFSSVKELTVKLEGSANFLHWSFELRVALNMIGLAGQVLDNERDVMTQTEKGFASNLMIRSMNLSQRSLVANIDLMEPAEIYAFLRSVIVETLKQ